MSNELKNHALKSIRRQMIQNRTTLSRAFVMKAFQIQYPSLKWDADCEVAYNNALVERHQRASF